MGLIYPDIVVAVDYFSMLLCPAGITKVTSGPNNAHQFYGGSDKISFQPDIFLPGSLTAGSQYKPLQIDNCFLPGTDFPFQIVQANPDIIIEESDYQAAGAQQQCF